MQLEIRGDLIGQGTETIEVVTLPPVSLHVLQLVKDFVDHTPDEMLDGEWDKEIKAMIADNQLGIEKVSSAMHRLHAFSVMVDSGLLWEIVKGAVAGAKALDFVGINALFSSENFIEAMVGTEMPSQSATQQQQ